MSKKRKEVTEGVIREWEAQNLRLLEECRAFAAGLLTYLPKRNGISALMAKIEGMHEEIHRRLQPPPPRDTTYDAVFAHQWTRGECALCGAKATNYLTFTNSGHVLSVDLCERCSEGIMEKGLPSLLKELQERLAAGQ